MPVQAGSCVRGVDRVPLAHERLGPCLGEPVLNYNPLFIERARQCEEEGDALPNFVAVDFYDIGDLFEVVDALNGF